MKKKYYLFRMKPGIISILSCIILVIIVVITLFIKKTIIIDFNNLNTFLFFISLIFYLGLHEVLHSIAYVLGGAKFKKITYGIALELGVLYCLCKQNITKKNILVSLMFPLVFIGIITYIISIKYNLPLLMFLSIFNISGCSGDIIMFIFISRIKNIEFSEMDDPISFALYSNDDLSKKSIWGIEYIECKDKIDRNDLQKVKVSSTSYYVLAGLVLLCLLGFLIGE